MRFRSGASRCWLDEKALKAGADIYEEVDQAIRHRDKVLLCCSEASLTSWWVDREVDLAEQKEARLWKERGERTLALIPLDIDGYLFEGWESHQKGTILGRKVADFTGWATDNAKFEAQFEQVIRR